MLGIGTPELLVIGLIIVIFYGPDRLPHLLAKVSRVFGDIRNAGHDVRQQLGREIAKVESDIINIAQDPHAQVQQQDKPNEPVVLPTVEPDDE